MYRNRFSGGDGGQGTLRMIREHTAAELAEAWGCSVRQVALLRKVAKKSPDFIVSSVLDKYDFVPIKPYDAVAVADRPEIVQWLGYTWMLRKWEKTLSATAFWFDDDNPAHVWQAYDVVNPDDDLGPADFCVGDACDGHPRFVRPAWLPKFVWNDEARKGRYEDGSTTERVEALFLEEGNPWGLRDEADYEEDPDWLNTRRLRTAFPECVEPDDNPRPLPASVVAEEAKLRAG